MHWLLWKTYVFVIKCKTSVTRVLLIMQTCIPIVIFKAKASLAKGSKSTITIISVIPLKNDLKGYTFSTEKIQGYLVHFKTWL